MATTLDTLLVRIEADLTGLRQDLSKVEGQIKNFGSSANNSLKNVENATASASSAMKALGVAIGAALGAVTIGKVVSVIREFEDLEARLKSITPDAETAAAAFTLITKYSETTTFQLQEVTQAFITLASAGIAPTKQVLIDVGNLAAARGKRIQDVAQAIMNATTGEFEMLKSLGIVVRTEGDNAVATFNGVSTTINKSNILEYLQRISQTNFADATAKAADTLTGKLSNLEDAVNRFYNQIGEGGLKTALIDLVLMLTETTDSGGSLAQTIGQALGAAVRGLNSAIVFLKDNFALLTKVVLSFLAILTAQKIVTLATAMITFALSTGKAAAAFAALSTLLAKNKVMILALALLAASEALGILDPIIEKLNEKIFGTAKAGEEVKQTMDEASDVIAQALGNKPVEQAQKFKDALQDLKNETAANKLEVQGWSKELIAAVKASGLLAQVNQSGIFKGNLNDLKELQTAVEAVEMSKADAAMFRLRRQIEVMGKEGSMSDLQKQFRQFIGDDTVALLEKYNVDLSKLFESFRGLKRLEAFKDVQKSLEDLKLEAKTTDEFEVFFAKLTESARKVLTDGQLSALYEQARAVFNEIKNAEKIKESIGAGVSAVKSFATEEERLRQTLADVEAARAAGKVGVEEYTRAIKKLNEQLIMTNPLMKAVGEVINQTETAMTSTLVNIFTGVETAGEAFKNFFRNLTTMLLQEVTKMLVVVPIMNSIRSALGMPTTEQVALGSSYGIIGSSLRERASGGAVSSGMPTIVGERGPELFVPQSAGTILNSNNTRSALSGGGGVVVHQTIAITTGVQATVRAEISNMMPQIAEVTKAAVAQAATRGGSYRKAFA